MNIRQLFPLGKAYGEAFCNRESETEQLVGNIKSCKHTLIIAPRRYGKSSLAERAIEKSNINYAKINFHLCTSEEEIAQLVLDGVIRLIGKSTGNIEKAMISIKKYLNNLEPHLSFAGEVASLKLVSRKKENYSVIISEALLLLEKLLAEKEKRAILFLDEFQEIAQIGKNGGIEGAFRTAAQEMNYLSLIFSGSIRSLLLSMFENENRPLYKLCRKIKLERISGASYEKHIQNISLKTWGKKLDDDVFNKMMELSNRHPYYVNYLADCIWEKCRIIPVISDVISAWQDVVKEEWSDALKELSSLPIGQRRLLKYIANHYVENIQSQETCAALSMAASSIATAAHALIEKDYIEQDSFHGFKIINPLLLTVLRGVLDDR